MPLTNKIKERDQLTFLKTKYNKNTDKSEQQEYRHKVVIFAS
jgi:hypothetical protein